MPVTSYTSSCENIIYVLFLFTWPAFVQGVGAGMNVLLVLLLFVAILMSLFVSSLHINSHNNFMKLLPRNTTAAIIIGHVTDTFTKYASCPKCHSVYSLDTCKVVLPDKSVCSRLCSYIAFPHHPHAQQRRPCGWITFFVFTL